MIVVAATHRRRVARPLWTLLRLRGSIAVVRVSSGLAVSAAGRPHCSHRRLHSTATPSPALSSAWSSLPLSSAMLSAVSAVGLDGGATAIQQSAIRAAAAPSSACPDALLLATRTGGGKTLAALIPALERAMAAERERHSHQRPANEEQDANEAEDEAERCTRTRRLLSQPFSASPGSPVPPPPSSASASSPLPPPARPSPLRLLSPATLFVAASGPSSSSAVSRVLCRPLSIVVAPSRELVEQHYRTAKQLSHHLPARVERLMAGRTRAKERRDLSSAAAATGTARSTQPGQSQHEVSVLVSTPSRLLSYIERGLVSLSRLRTVVLDEADVLLSAASEGGFRDDCLRLVRLAKTAAAPSLAGRVSSSSPLLFLLSAASVPHSLRALLPSLFPLMVDLSSPQLHTLPPSVRLSFVPVNASDKMERLISVVRDIVHTHPQPCVLLFCNSLGSCRAVLAALTDNLQQHPLPQHIAARYSQSAVLAHHGDLPGQLRTRHLQAFRSGECCVLVVTDVLSRGLDLPQLTHVLQFDMSLNPTDFMHRVGRLARQPLAQLREPQLAISLVRKGDEVLATAIAAQFRASGSVVELSSDKRHYTQQL